MDLVYEKARIVTERIILANKTLSDAFKSGLMVWLMKMDEINELDFEQSTDRLYRDVRDGYNIHQNPDKTFAIIDAKKGDGTSYLICMDSRKVYKKNTRYNI